MDLFNLINSANRVYIVGNGGSYANSVHLCNDLLSVGIRAFAPDPATLTAFANDHGYETVFARWLSVVGEKGDLLIALSGSGKSANILKACEEAERIGMKVHREFGVEKGFDMQGAEEYQVFLGHELMRALRDRS